MSIPYISLHHISIPSLHTRSTTIKVPCESLSNSPSHPIQHAVVRLHDRLSIRLQQSSASNTTPSQLPPWRVAYPSASVEPVLASFSPSCAPGTVITPNALIVHPVFSPCNVTWLPESPWRDCRDGARGCLHSRHKFVSSMLFGGI